MEAPVELQPLSGVREDAAVSLRQVVVRKVGKWEALAAGEGKKTGREERSLPVS